MAKNKPRLRSFSKVKVLPLAAMVIVFGGIGAYFVTQSKAATSSPEFVIFTDTARAKLNNPWLVTIQDDVQYVDTKDVVQLAVGKTANFSPNKGGGNPIPIKDCYYMRAVDKQTNVTITSGAAKKTVNVPVSNNSYQEYCVTYAAGAYPGFDVKSNGSIYGSPSKLNVYQRAFHYTRSDQSDW